MADNNELNELNELNGLNPTMPDGYETPEDVISEIDRVREKIDTESRGPGRKRTYIERNMDLVDITRFYLQGYSMQEIGFKMGEIRPYTLSWEMVRQSLKIVHERWLDNLAHELDLHKAKELARIDRMEQEAWEAWFKSKNPKLTLEVLKTSDAWAGKGAHNRPTYTREKKRQSKEERDPNYKYLEIIQWCITQRCSILGLDAPKQVTINWRKQAEEAGINPEEYVTTLADNLFQAAVDGGRGPRSLGAGPTQAGDPQPET